MISKKLIDSAATLLLFVGFVFAFLPHALHSRIGLSDQTSHLKHVFIGIAMVIVALSILIYNNDALRFKFKRKPSNQ